MFGKKHGNDKDDSVDELRTIVAVLKKPSWLDFFWVKKTLRQFFTFKFNHDVKYLALI